MQSSSSVYDAIIIIMTIIIICIRCDQHCDDASIYKEEDKEMDEGLDMDIGHGGTGHLTWVKRRKGAKDEVKQARRAAN